MSNTTNRQNLNLTEIFAMLKFYINLLLSFRSSLDSEQSSPTTPTSASDFETKCPVHDELANIIMQAHADHSPTLISPAA